MTELQIVAEPGVPQIIITREFAAPRDLLFRALRGSGASRALARAGGTRRQDPAAAEHVFQSVEDRDGYVEAGMEKGVHESMANLDELVTTLAREA